MKHLLMIVSLLASSSAYAQDCSWFTNETRPEGEVIAQIQGDRVLEIRDQYTGVYIYDLISAGTGLPFQEAVPRDERGRDDRPGVRMHKGDLMIGLVAYTPYCVE